MKEVWLPVKDYEGLYEVSNLGNIKSLERYQNNRGKQQLVKERILKQSTNNCGYKCVELCKNGKRKSITVHRLVATAFVPNPENKPHVNHLDENKENNISCNLQWITAKDNNNYGSRNIRVSATKGFCVAAYYKNGTLYKKFRSMTEASRQTRINYQSIYMCVHGKQKHAGGYVWKRIVKEEGGIE